MNPPANWYPDPTGRHGQRYWDGSQWTEHVFTDGVQGVDALDLAMDDEDDEEEVDDATAGEELAGAVDDGGSAEAGASTPATDDDLWSSEDHATADDPFAVTNMDVDARALFGAEDDAGEDPGAGLFVDAGAEEPEGDPWRPADGPATDGAVAPEVEPGDVVAAVDELADAPGDPDFSDAFVLAPETASRLVGGGERVPATDEEARAEAADDTVEDADDLDAGPPADAVGEDEAAPASTPARTDTPAASAAPRPAPASLGITGDLVGGAFAEREGAGAVVLQNSRLLRCSAAEGLIARQGTMVAYQGDVGFERQGAGGVGRALKRAATGEGLAMMRVTGTGDVFFADGAQHVFLLHLDGGPGLSVNGRNVLAFSSSLQWDIERVKGATLLAGGLFNTTLRGTGWVALVADGQPVVLRTDEAPTFVDVNALVAWSGGLGTSIVNTIGAKSLVGLGPGEAFQMAFEGSGIVVVQPSEGPSTTGG